MPDHSNLQFKQLSFLLPLIMSLTLIGCEERIRPSVLTELDSRELPSHESWNSTITFSDSGMIRAVLKVGHLKKYDERQMTLLDGGLHVDFFNTRGQHTSVLTSLRGKVDDRTNDLEAEGNVIVVSDSGNTLETEKLLWKKSTQRVTSDEFVRIVSPKEEIRGHGFDSDESLTNYRIFRVTGQTSMGR